MAMRYFQYLTRSIAEGQKKSIAEWNTLIRMSLSEIDDLIKGAQIANSVETYSFDEYRREIEKIAAARGVEIPQAARETPVIGGRNSRERFSRGKSKS
jgi:hypothetical protein